MTNRPALLLALVLGAAQSGCIVAGYSTRGGWFLWPGGLGLIILLLVLMLMRR